MPTQPCDPSLYWTQLRRAGCPKAREALIAHYTPLLRRTAERLLAGGHIDARIGWEEYAEAALPALITAINEYDPDRRGFGGRQLAPRNWIIGLLWQSMRDHSQREGRHFSPLAPMKRSPPLSEEEQEEEARLDPTRNNHLRRIEAITLDSGEEETPAELVPDPAADPAEAAHLHYALSRLPWLQRQAVTGLYLEGRTSAEVAAALGIPAATLRRHVLPRAREKLARSLGGGGLGKNDHKVFFRRGGRMPGKKLTEWVGYRDTPEGYGALVRLAASRGCSVAECLRQLAREAVKREAKVASGQPPAQG